MTDDIGDIMTRDHSRAWKAIALAASMLVYAGALIYSGVHNYTLMRQGMPPEMLIWAVVGVLAMEISAAALPLAIHNWTHQATQRIAALAFYALDGGMIFLNVVLDYAINAGNVLPSWGMTWLLYGVPATPVLMGFGWTILWLLDPAARERAMIERLRSATTEMLANRIARAARRASITDSVNAAAEQMTDEIISHLLATNIETHTHKRNLPAISAELPAQENPTQPRSLRRTRSQSNSETQNGERR